MLFSALGACPVVCFSKIQRPLLNGTGLTKGNGLQRVLARTWICGVLVALFLAGCASDTRDCQRLNQQQSATLSSLEREIIRLNQELEDVAVARSALGPAKARLEETLAEEMTQGMLSFELGRRGLAITVQDRELFDAGTNQIKRSAEVFLDKIAAVIAQDLPGRYVLIEGHTDNEPVADADGVTNWEYSADRAMAVLHYFVDAKSLPPEQFRVMAYGEYQPVASNQDGRGRDQNRRVVIVVTSEKTATS